jgi:hypothetical protein
MTPILSTLPLTAASEIKQSAIAQPIGAQSTGKVRENWK